MCLHDGASSQPPLLSPHNDNSNGACSRARARTCKHTGNRSEFVVFHRRHMPPSLHSIRRERYETRFRLHPRRIMHSARRRCTNDPFPLPLVFSLFFVTIPNPRRCPDANIADLNYKWSVGECAVARAVCRTCGAHEQQIGGCEMRAVIRYM